MIAAFAYWFTFISWLAVGIHGCATMEHERWGRGKTYFRNRSAFVVVTLLCEAVRPGKLNIYWQFIKHFSYFKYMLLTNKQKLAKHVNIIQMSAYIIRISCKTDEIRNFGGRVVYRTKQTKRKNKVRLRTSFFFRVRLMRLKCLIFISKNVSNVQVQQERVCHVCC